MNSHLPTKIKISVFRLPNQKEKKEKKNEKPKKIKKERKKAIRNETTSVCGNPVEI